IPDLDRGDRAIGAANDFIETDLLLKIRNYHTAIVRVRDQQVDAGISGTVDWANQRVVAVVGDLLHLANAQVERQGLIGVEPPQTVGKAGKRRIQRRALIVALVRSEVIGQ